MIKEISNAQIIRWKRNHGDDCSLAHIATAYCALAKAIGWDERDEKQMEIALCESLFAVLISDFKSTKNKAPKAIAAARMLGDNIYNAIIYDLMVHPDYRKKGYGAMALKECLAHSRVEYTELIACPESASFYRKLGLQPAYAFRVATLQGDG